MQIRGPSPSFSAMSARLQPSRDSNPSARTPKAGIKKDSVSISQTARAKQAQRQKDIAAVSNTQKQRQINQTDSVDISAIAKARQADIEKDLSYSRPGGGAA
ncbi:MAG: hypothetical protein V1754_07830 [Pseudomonadota bacterium]